MKREIIEPNPRFFFDKHGNKVDVLLDIQTYDQLMEHYEDHCLGKMASEVLATESKEEYVDLKEFIKSLGEDSSDE